MMLQSKNTIRRIQSGLRIAGVYLSIKGVAFVALGIFVPDALLIPVALVVGLGLTWLAGALIMVWLIRCVGQISRLTSAATPEMHPPHAAPHAETPPPAPTVPMPASHNAADTNTSRLKRGA